MLNFQHLLMGGMMMTALTITSLPALADLILTTPNILTQQPSRRPRIPGGSTETAIDTFMDTFNRRRTRTPGISRGGGFCPIAPGLVETDKIWSDRPLFIWRGAVERVQLRKLGNREVFWSQKIEPQKHSIAYNGEALQPGQLYQWELLGESNTNVSFVFQVIEAEQRLPIATQLQEIETRLQANGQNQEAIAIQQAQYFAEQGLWSDALQLLYAIDNPSPKTTQAIQEIESKLCDRSVP